MKRILLLLVLGTVAHFCLFLPPVAGQEVEMARLEEDAKNGYPVAQCLLGMKYMGGIGVRRDYQKAREWYEKAAAQDYAMAQYFLGVMYMEGLGVRQDYQKAHDWWEKAAVQGNADAQFNLGVMYRKVDRVRQEYQEAHEL